MNASKLCLYVDAQFTSPYAMSCFVALREKGIEFQMKTLDLDTLEHQTQDYSRISVTQRVPTLVHGEFSLAESSAITEYLEDLFPQTPIYPTSPQQRAKARQVQAWLRSDLLPIRKERSTLVVFYGVKYGALSASAVASTRKLVEAAQLLLRDSPDYLFGQWSTADVDLALMLNRLILNGDRLPARLEDYAQRQWQRPTVQEWLQLERPPL
ncbi:glutathione transferase [Pseudomonas juntendi]|uniref:glutathione transferase n=1 Tax=Pseudomonas TaxID=286 RepID=UPI000DA047DC|nr:MULTISPECIES: glutathione transferase [Pseudomonas]MBH3382856.1 glutathione transferase [Pseudomonas juntendi]PYC08995.1 glutathione transferase [Pseudomonas sp. MB-090624]WBM32903.1 glutathione transferase [Pseudomonas sp. NY11382]WDM59399.1 glutathione transferase [Pseudomonas sp. NEEL19]